MKVYHTDRDNSFCEEIGQCRHFHLSYPPGSELVLTGGVVDLNKIKEESNVNLMLVDWKTQVPVHRGNNLRVEPLDRYQYKDLLHCTKALLAMMGGAVVVSREDLEAVSEKDIVTTRNLSGVVVRLEDL